MNTAGEQLRGALAKGFYSENLLFMALLVAELRRKEQVSNPVASFVIEQVLRNVHTRWFEQQPSTVELAKALESRLAKLIEATLLVTDPQALIACMNDLVRAYDDCRKEVPPSI